MCTQPELIPVITFLSAYNHNPSPDHLKLDLYSLCYIHSTFYLGIQLSSASATEPHAQIRHPFPHEKEAYIYTSASTPTSQNELIVYWYACCLSQIDSAMKEGTYL